MGLREELQAAMELPPPSLGADPLDMRDGITVAPVNRSLTALELDDWSMRRGREVLEQSDLMQKVFEHPDKEQLSDAQLATADFHAAAFEPDPRLAKHCQNERIHQYMKNLMETPEFQALHRETQLDEVAAELAAASFAQEWVALVKTDQPDDEFKRDVQALSAASRALKQAAGDVGSLRDAQNALGIGGHGGGNGTMSADDLAKMFKRVRRSHSLKRICDLAGRYRRFAQAQQRKKVLHGQDDVVGVVLDGDVGRLLPHELVALDDPDLELDVMRRIIERQAMCREYRGVETRARGPIVVVVDESGSMNGEKIYTAKAMALALAWVARQQRRWCCLVGFSGGSEGTWCVLQPGQENSANLMEWLEHFYGGGTSCDVPLVEVPANWEKLGCPRGKTDMIIVTDGQVNLPDDVRDAFLAWKQREQVKLVTLVIQDQTDSLNCVSDRVHHVSSLSVDEDAVGEVLGT